MTREDIAEAIRRDLHRQEQRGRLAMAPGDDPDTFHIHGQVDLISLAEAVREARRAS
jgi:hypothetical protein